MGSICIARKAGTTFETIRCFSHERHKKLVMSASLRCALAYGARKEYLSLFYGTAEAVP